MMPVEFSVPPAFNRSIHIEEVSNPDFYPNFHRHQEYQIMWIRKGEGVLVVDDRAHPFTEDDAFFIGQNKNHVFKKSKDFTDNIEYLSIYIDFGGLMSSFLEVPEFTVIKNFINAHCRGFKISELFRVPLLEKIERLKNAMPIEQIFLMIHIFDFLQNSPVAFPALGGTSITNVRKINGCRLRDVQTYIERHYAEHISLESVAEKAHLTP